MGNVERRLQKLEAHAPPAVSVADEDLPIEEWTEELLSNDQGPSLYSREEDEWARFRGWAEMIGIYLCYQLGHRIASARGEQLAFEDPTPPLSEEVIERVVPILEPFIESWRVRYEEAAPQREAKRRSYERWRRGGGGWGTSTSG